jgi:hypothetical protein
VFTKATDMMILRILIYRPHNLIPLFMISATFMSVENVDANDETSLHKIKEPG